jgi:hypothetical protein
MEDEGRRFVGWLEVVDRNRRRAKQINKDRYCINRSCVVLSLSSYCKEAWNYACRLLSGEARLRKGCE